MHAQNIGETADTKKSGVIFVRRPGFELHADNRTHHARIVAEREASPLCYGISSADVGIPRQAAEAVEIRHCEVVPQPVLIQTDIGNTNKAARRTMENAARHERLHGSVTIRCMQIEVEHFFPHRGQITKMTLLARVLLGDLQFERFVGGVQGAEQRRHRLTYLEIDRTVLDLHQNVVVEHPIQLVKIVPGRTGAIVLQIAPIHVVVVDESAVKQETAMRLQRAGNQVSGVGVGSAIGRRSHAPFGIGFQYEAAKIRDGRIHFIHFLFPPYDDFRVKRIEGVQSADLLRAAEIHRDGHANAPGPG